MAQTRRTDSQMDREQIDERTRWVLSTSLTLFGWGVHQPKCLVRYKEHCFKIYSIIWRYLHLSVNIFHYLNIFSVGGHLQIFVDIFYSIDLFLIAININERINLTLHKYVSQVIDITCTWTKLHNLLTFLQKRIILCTTYQSSVILVVD